MSCPQNSNPGRFDHHWRPDGCLANWYSHRAAASGASIFVSHWHVGAVDKAQGKFRSGLGIAITSRTYKAYRDLQASRCRQKLTASGAVPQRVLWASMETKYPAARGILYIKVLAATDTTNTLPEAALLAFADHGRVADSMPSDSDSAETCSRQLPAQASILKHLPPIFGTTARRRSSSHGTI